MFPKDSYLVVNRIYNENTLNAVDSAIEEKRDDNQVVVGSYVLDITVYDADGNAIEPDTTYGSVAISFGIESMQKLPVYAEEIVKDQVAEQAEAIVNESVGEENQEAVLEAVPDAVEELGISYAVNDIDITVYHMDDSYGYYVADELYTTEQSYDNSIGYAEKIVAGETYSFSTYVIEATTLADLLKAAQTVAEGAMNTLAEDAPADPIAWGSYVMNGVTSMTLSEILEDMGKTLTVFGAESKDGVVDVTQTGTDPTTVAPLYTITAPQGGAVGTIAIYGSDGNEYDINISTNVPASEEEDVSFTVIWNDNTGNTDIDSNNLVDRPSVDAFSYEIEYTTDGTIYYKLSDASEIWRLGLTEVPEVTVDTDTNSNEWVFNVPSVPTSITSEGTTTNVTYRFTQTAVDGYLSDSNSCAQNGSITNTVETRFIATIIWNDNLNAYTSRLYPASSAVGGIFNVAEGDLVLKRYNSYTGVTEDLPITDNLIMCYADYDGEYYLVLNGLPNYDADGNEYTYMVVSNLAVNTTTDTTPGDSYAITYENVENYSARVDAVCTDGVITETLNNITQFNYSKYWHDGDTDPADRPNAKLYLYAIPEDWVVDGTFDVTQASPIENYEAVTVSKEDGTDMTVITGLPLYDISGQRLVYFALETGLTGDYVSGVDNSTAGYITNGTLKTNYTKDVIDTFDSVTSSYQKYMSTENYPKYMLNGGVIDNRLTANTTVDYELTLNAAAVQSTKDSKVEFTLQRFDPETNTWETVDYSETIEKQGEGDVTSTRFDIRSELMMLSGSSPLVPKYDEDGNLITYRWLENEIVINADYGSGADLGVVWDGKEVTPAQGVSYSYDIPADEGISVGTVAPGVGDELTDLYVYGTTDVVYENGKWVTKVDNTINAPMQIDIIKTWGIQDSEGQDVTDAAKVVTDLGITLTLHITRDDGLESGVDLYDLSGNLVEDIVLTGKDASGAYAAWEALQDNLPRYDVNGKEYEYDVSETIGYTDAFRDYIESLGYDRNVVFGSNLKYTQSVETNAEDEKLKQLEANFGNYIGPGEGITIAAEKAWLDGSDLQSRDSIIIGVYKINESLPILVGTMVLNEANNWYEEMTIASGTIAMDGTEITDIGQSSDYIAIELGLGNADGYPVVPMVYTLGGLEYDYKTFNTGVGAQLLESLQAAVESRTKIGTIADQTGTIDTDPEEYSEYTYNVYGLHTTLSTGKDGYLYTNQRVADMAIEYHKTWQDGGKLRTGGFTLKVRVLGETVESHFELPGEDEVGSITIEGVEYPINAAKIGDNSYTVTIEGLPKYNSDGDAYNYEITEDYIVDDDGTHIDVSEGTLSNGDHYAFTSTSQTVYGGEAEIIDGTLYDQSSYTHHFGDITVLHASNTLSGSYEVSLNKVWYDDYETANRPNISYSIYRIAAAKFSTTGAKIDNPETFQGQSIADYIESDEFTEEGLAAMLSLIDVNNREVITSDRLWDTHFSDYYWTASVGQQSKYDAEGYYYVYFAKENGVGGDTEYYAEYVNTYDQPDRTGATPREILDIIDDTTATGYKTGVTENVLILSDGYHPYGESDKSSIYSRTTVNVRQNEKIISGRKLWKLPKGWTISDGDMPSLDFVLYRSSEDLTTEGSSVYTNAEIKQWIADGKLTDKILEVHLNQSGESTGTDYYSSNYRYSIDKSDYTNGILLEKYDEYGQTYYYYLMETEPLILGYTDADIEFNDNTFNVTNVYAKEDYPTVVITGEKNWAIDPTGLVDEDGNLLSLDDMPAVTITLYAQASDGEGNPVDSFAPVKVASTTLDPSSIENASDLTSGTLSFTFDKYENYGFDGERLADSDIPYYGPNGEPFLFYVTETIVSGYDQKISVNGVEKAYTKDTIEYINLYPDGNVYRNKTNALGDDVAFSNTYDGDTTSFTGNKIWKDEYVDNNPYRPDAIKLTVNRRSATFKDGDSSYEGEIIIAGNKKANEWSGKLENLLKYDYNGKAFIYYIVSEEFGSLDDAGNFVSEDPQQIAEVKSDEIGNYTLTATSANTFTNTLADSVTLTFSKNWTIDDENGHTAPVSWAEFINLIYMNVLPKEIRYTVQRSTDGVNWEYVPGNESESYKDQYTVVVDNQTVLGYYVNLYNITTPTQFNSVFNILMNTRKWSNLPKTDTDKNPYTYRLVEVMSWGKRGSGTTTSTTYTFPPNGQEGSVTVHDIDSSFALAEDSTDTAVKLNLTNHLDTIKVRLAKEWVDENDYNNTRPSSITLTLKSTETEEELEYTLKTNKTEEEEDGTSIYYSDYIDIPVSALVNETTANAAYTLTEKYTQTTIRGTDIGTYTLTPTSGFTFINNAGDIVFKLTNTTNDDRKLITIDATKTWDDADTTFEQKLRPEITFNLQYLKQGGNAANADDWITVTADNISTITADTTQVASYTIPAGSTTKVDKKSWSNLFKYWTNPSLDGEPELIQYRVKETMTVDNSSYVAYVGNTQTDTLTFNFTDAVNAYSGTITNRIVRQDIKIKKSWSPEDGGNLTETIANLVEWGALPEYIYFKLYYKLTGDTDYTYYDTFAYKTVELAATKTLAKALPAYDAQGNLIQYKVEEACFTYSLKYDDHQTEYLENANIRMLEPEKETQFTTAWEVDFDNTIKTTSVSATKTWQDENDREGYETTITLQLQRDGSNYGPTKTITKNSDGTWTTATWVDLPYYKNDAGAGQRDEDHASVYTVVEVPVTAGHSTNYITTYTPASVTGYNDSRNIVITNTYVPERGTITVTKEWSGDESWADVTRPNEIDVRLEYSIDNGTTWNTVTANTLDANNLYPDDGIYTTNVAGGGPLPIYQRTDGTWSTITWENLPVYYGGHEAKNKVLYRVVEIDTPKDYTPYLRVGGQAVNYVTLSNETTTAATEYNVLKTTSITVQKNWMAGQTKLNMEQFTQLVSLGIMPTSLTMIVEYSTDGTTWTPVPTLGGTDTPGQFTYDTITYFINKMTVDAKLPQYDVNGNLISYRVREIAATYADGTIVTTKDEGTTVGNFNVTVSPETANWNGSATSVPAFTVENAYEAGSISIQKVWNDENNRENKEVAVQIRLLCTSSDQSAGITVTLNAGNSWKYTSDKIFPIYQRESQIAKFQYQILEITDLSRLGYTAVYSYVPSAGTSGEIADGGTLEITASNIYAPERGTITAAKIWNDEDNKYDSRPEDSEVTVKLQYSINGGRSWSDVTKVAEGKVQDADGNAIPYAAADGETIPTAYTTSDLEQIINGLSGDDAKTASWANLPVYANVGNSAVKILYKVVELTDLSEGYTVAVAAETVNVTKDQSTNVTVTNTLKETQITVTKTWTENASTSLNSEARPDKVVFTLEYSTDGTNWEKVPATDANGLEKDGEITMTVSKDKTQDAVTVRSLPIADADKNAYVYRVSEASIVYGEAVIAADGSKVGPYSVVEEAAEELEDGTWTASAANTLVLGKITATKTWNDEDDRDQKRPTEINLTLYRAADDEEDDLQIGETVTIKADAEGKWPTYTWENLPVYLNDGSEAQYYVVEEEVEDYSTIYNNQETARAAMTSIKADGSDTTISIINSYGAEKGIIEANKIWDDYGDAYGTRPANSEVQVALQYRLSDTDSWTNVPKYAEGTSQIVSTASETIQTINGKDLTAIWTELPVNASGNVITYRVVEVNAAGTETELKGYTVSAAPETVTLENHGANVTLTNTITTTELTVTKNWNEGAASSELVEEVQPRAVVFHIEYSTDKTNWKDLPATITNGLSEAGYYELTVTAESKTDSATIKGLPVVTADGQEYEYRVSEAKLVYGEATVAADGSRVGPYNYVVGVTMKGTDGKWSVTADNTLILGSITATKTWNDEDNRDQKRPTEINLTLYRVVDTEGEADKQIGETVTIKVNEDGTWPSYTWNNLPVYQTDGAQAQYYVVEEAVDLYSTTYDGKETAADAKTTIKAAGTTPSDSTTIAIENTYEVQKGMITVEKNWEDDDNRYNTRPEDSEVQVMLQYSLTGSAPWTNVPVLNEKAPQEVYTSTTELIQTINGLTGDAAKTAKWEGLPLNALNAEGESVAVSYRVIEVTAAGKELNLSGYTVTADPETVTLTEEGDFVVLTNTLDTTKITISKTWDENGAEEAAKIQPSAITFLVQYRLVKGDMTSPWKNLPDINNGYETLTAADKTEAGSWTADIENLPLEDAAGQKYEYCVSEASITYLVDGKEVTVNTAGSFDETNTSWEGTAGAYTGSAVLTVNDDNSYTVTAKNELEVADLEVIKDWDDEDDRDGVRTEVTLQLYRDGEAYGQAVTLTSDDAAADNANRWQYKWTNLPMYKNTATGHTVASKSVYYVVETVQADGYEVTYIKADGTVTQIAAESTRNAGDTAPLQIVNTHKPVKGTLDATKYWDDQDNSYGQRPESIELKLQYHLEDDTDWKDVTKAELNDHNNYADGGVHTTSDVTQTVTGDAQAKSWTTVTWENLPLTAKNADGESQRICYKAVEVNNPAGYKVVYSAGDGDVLVETEEGSGVYSASQDVTNEMLTTSIELSKEWKDSENWTQFTRPTAITFFVEYKSAAEGAQWAALTTADNTTVVNGLITITADDDWAKTIEKLPVKDVNNNDYSYRVSEKSVVVNGTTIDLVGIWDASGLTWTSTSVSAYAGTVTSAEEDDMWIAEAVNEMATGKLSVSKTWADGNNRDGMRTEEVTITLYRIDQVNGSPLVQKFQDSVTVKGTDWTVSWDDLPLYTTDGTTVKSKYYVTEESVDGYKTTYTVELSENAEDAAVELDGEVEITNTHEPKTLTIDAEKEWKDQSNYYGLRDTEITLVLQYSLDGTTWVDADAEDSIVVENTAVAKRPAPSEDDGSKIYSASANVQTLTGSAITNTWSKASWADLSAYVLVDGESTEVQYRVAERPVSKGYASTESAVVSYTAIEGETRVATVTVTNELDNPNSLEVTKTWNPSEELMKQYNALPDKIRVQLQYKDKDDEQAEWKNVEKNGTADLTADNGWKHTFGPYLRSNYEYRAVEVSMTWYLDGDVTRTIYVNGESATYVTTGKIGSYEYDSVTTAPAEGSVLYQTAITNEMPDTTISVTKTWKDEDNRDSLRTSIDVTLLRDGKEIAQGTIEQKDDGSWTTVTWENLPLFKNGYDSEDGYSEYVVKETGADEKYETPVYVITIPSEEIETETVIDEAADVKVVEGQETSVEIYNIYYPEKGKVTATKVWDDFSNFYGDRPETIYLTLKYQLEGETEWKNVEAAQYETEEFIEAETLYVDGHVRAAEAATQMIIATEGDSQTAVWTNLPLTAKDETGTSRKVVYKVFETDKDGNIVVGAGESENSSDEGNTDDVLTGADLKNEEGEETDVVPYLYNYKITYSSEGDIIVEGVDEVEQTITNTLEKTELTLSKTWEGDEGIYSADGTMAAKDLVRPAAITFLVEYSNDNGESWNVFDQAGDDPLCVDGFVVLTAESGWADVTIENMPLTVPEGFNYLYRANEFSIEMSDGTVILCEDTTAGETGKVGAYDGQTVTEMNDRSWTAKAKNPLATGSLTVTKTWNDSNDREGIRPEAITFTLHWVDCINGDTLDKEIDVVTLTADKDGTWPSFTWENLPIWTTDGSELSRYYVVETTVDGYETTYTVEISAGEVITTEAPTNKPEDTSVFLAEDVTSEIAVINTHDVTLFTINADKLWDDYNNKYQKRDTSVVFTLQYSLDGGSTWKDVEKLAVADRPNAAEDEGTGVWTSSDVQQTVTGSTATNTWAAEGWKDVVAYALNEKGESVEVLYRVTEAVTNNQYYVMINGENVSYSNADPETHVAKTQITNKMNTIPQTGDTSNGSMWMLLMLCSLLAIMSSGTTLMVNRKRRKQ